MKSAMSGKYFVPGFSTTIGFRCIALLCFLFAIQQHCYAQKGKGTDRLYYTQLKTAEAYYRHNQIGEAKNILLAVYLPILKQ